MKKLAFLMAVLGLVATLRAQDETTGYSVFRICQDQRVIHTSDGADVGHVEYILVDPTQQRIVSTVITGGAIGDRYVAVPYEDVQFQGDSGDIVLNNIDRERIVSAPAVEVNQLTSSRRVETSFVQPSVSYFGTSTERRTTGAETSTSINREQTGSGANMETGQPAAAESSAQRTEQNRQAAESSPQRAEQNQPPPSPSEAGTPSQERNPQARNSAQPTPGEPQNNASTRHHHRQLNAEGGASGTPSASETPGSSASGRRGSSAEQSTPAPEGQTGSTARHHHHASAADQTSSSGSSARSERTPGTSTGESSASEASQGSRSSAGSERGAASESAGRTHSSGSASSESRKSGSSSRAPESSSSSSEHSAQGSSTP